MGFDRHSTAMQVAAQADLRGRTALVTGATSGLGVATAHALAAAGADLILGVRDRDAGRLMANKICAETGRQVLVGVLDLSNPSSVVSFAQTVTDRPEALGILVANAGVSKTLDAHTADGLDVRFATNHLGHFLLANLLFRKLALNGARVVVLSSAAHKGRPLHFDDMQWQSRPRDDLMAYGESKTANILFAMEATKRWSSDGIFANAVLPGSVLTGLQRYHGDELKRLIGFFDEQGKPNPAMKTVEQGAATTIWAATAPELESRGGLVLEDCALALPVGPETHPWTGFDASVTEELAAYMLWERSTDILAALDIII
jgi:NAD(P)-dependent dehydrogenase (short-subunit alcohol dehydrogenase family)